MKSRPKRSRISSRIVTRRHGLARSIVLAVALDRRAAERPLGDVAEHFFGHGGHVVVIGVGAHELDDRELGAVLGGDALVAEHLAHVVDVLHAADDAAVEEQLDGDAQVQVAVERVVVGRERPRAGAAGERLQRGRFDLHEVAFVEPLADREHDLGARDEQLARLLVGEQVELAVAVAGAGVAEPVVLVRRRAQRLGQQRALLHRQRELAALGHVHAPFDADDVADVEAQDAVVVLLPERVDAHDHLDRARQVAHVEERRLAVPAARDQPPGDLVAQLRVLALLELAPGRGRRARRRSACACPTG